MALYVKIPKDPEGVKDKMIFNLTKRQIMFCGIGLALGMSAYWLTYKAIGTTGAAVILFCLGSPFFVMSKYAKYGVFTAEKNILNFIRWLIYPKIRLYKTENIYRVIDEDIQYKKEVKMLETGKKQIKYP